MGLFAWDESFQVNVREFDEQHKKLIGYANELNDAMKMGRGKAALSGVLRNLVAYAETHFSAEEKKMASLDYPGYLAHKREHDELISRVLEFQREYEADRLALSVRLMEFLKDWITNHLLNTDRKYTKFFNERGVV